MTLLLQNAAAGTVLILVTALLRRSLKNRLAPEVWLTLWAVCLLRLLTPVAPESALSVYGLLNAAAPIHDPAPPVTQVTIGLTANAAPGTAWQTVPSVGTAEQPFPWQGVLLAVWLLVAAAAAARYVLAWFRTRRAVSHAIPLNRDDPRHLHLPRFARLREGPMEGAPLTFGAVRPTVVLCPGLTAGELECVLAHEGIHARRRDNLWHYATAVALTVFWWDPAVWLMARLIRRDVELSCDRAAVKLLGADKRADYAKALVSLSTQTEGPAFCHTFGRKAAEERILAVMKYKKMSVCSIILAVALVCGVTVAFASSPKAPQESDTEQVNQMLADTLELLEQAQRGEADLFLTPEEVVINSAPVSDSSQVSIYTDGSMVTRAVIPLSCLDKDLSFHVAGSRMTQAEADRVLEQAKAIAKDGVLDWTFPADSALRYENTGESSSANGYWNEDGEFVKVSFSQIVELFILPQAMGEI